MRWLAYILLAATLIGSGCRSTEKKPPAQKTAQNTDPSTPFWASDPPPKSGAPAAAAAPVAVDGMLAGMVKDETGKLIPNAVVYVTATDAGPNAKPIGITADDSGIFMIRGLRAGTTYLLSVRAEEGGKVLAGSVFAEANNTHMLIRVREGASSITPPPMPNPGATSPLADGKAKLVDPAKGAAPPAPDPAPKKDPLIDGKDQSWAPGKVPPPGQPVAPPPPAGSPSNPNVTDLIGRAPPPVVNIPGMGIPEPKTGPPPPPQIPTMSAVPSNSSPIQVGATILQPPERRASFKIYDLAGDAVEFQNLTDRRLIVLDFWTTSCMPCLRKIPSLIDIQSRYGDYVTVVGIACDDLPWDQRKKQVEGIRDYYLRKAQRPINYPLYMEGDKQEGRVQQLFSVKVYPTMVLLDHSGQIKWRGSDPHQLEDAIRYYLQRR